MSHRSKNPALQGVQWRFLSSDVASGGLVQNESEFDQPMTDEAQRRIAYLEQALASTQDHDSQYQSFLMEAGKHAPGGHICILEQLQRHKPVVRSGLRVVEDVGQLLQVRGAQQVCHVHHGLPGQQRQRLRLHLPHA